MMVVSFILFLLAFVAVGALSVFKNRGSNADYLLASSSIKPWLVALSAVATNNSGWMFVGLVGFAATSGLQAFWVMFGFIVGDFIMSFLIHRKLRIATEDTGALSFGGVLAQWGGQDFKYFRFLAGLITIAFLGTYAAAQLNAGSKALHVLLGWDYSFGAMIGAAIVVIYCFAGGIRASIWTDAAQSFVMIFSIFLMLAIGLASAGGLGASVDAIRAADPALLTLWPQDTAHGAALFIIGWIFAGMGVIGQPHVMVRFMAMEDPDHMPRIRAYYYSWYTVFSMMAVCVGFCARVLLPFEAGFDNELAMPMLAQNTLPPALAGLALAGLFAATMSTADSQILSCTAAATRDLTGGKPVHYWLTKLATVVITGLALCIALFGDESVFSLVLIAWSALGAGFGPLLIVYALGGRPNQALSVLMSISGIVIILLWRHFELNGDIYELLPGIIGPLLIFYLGKILGFTVKD